MRKVLFILFIIVGLAGCNKKEIRRLNQLNEAYVLEINKLKSDILIYQMAPRDLLIQAKEYASKGNIEKLINVRDMLTKYHPIAEETTQVIELTVQLQEEIYSAEKKKALREIETSPNTPYYNDVLNNKSKCTFIAQEFVKSKLNNPNTFLVKSSSSIHELNNNQVYVSNNFIANNVFGIENNYVYKIWLNFKGGEWDDINNWSYSKLVLQNSNTGEVQIY